MEQMALGETSQLMFNMIYFFPQLAASFSTSIVPIFKLLSRDPLPRPLLQPPVTNLINALINLDLENATFESSGEDAIFPETDQKRNIGRVIDIFDSAIENPSDEKLDQTAIPVLTLIRRIHEHAPEEVKKYMQTRLLPAEEERDKPLGRSESLAARLLRITTSGLTPKLRESVSALLFELSGKDASKFVENVGYGYAAGFLLNHNIPMPENSTRGWGNILNNPVGGIRQTHVNPITGQRLDREPRESGPPMTEEEKEREAERLFVLFERYGSLYSYKSSVLTMSIGSRTRG